MKFLVTINALHRAELFFRNWHLPS